MQPFARDLRSHQYEHWNLAETMQYRHPGITAPGKQILAQDPKSFDRNRLECVSEFVVFRARRTDHA
ncbi:MAG: hypothetical protein Kow0074_04380 [Candidatus Zixiibacteriota bacterium]